MSQPSRAVLAQALKEAAREAASLYSDVPLDYKGRPVTPKVVLGTGDNSHYIDVILTSLNHNRGSKILDIGIAYGIYDVVLKNHFGFEVHGIDHPENISAYCRFPVQQGISVLPCDLHHDSLPYPDNTFDTVVASEVVEHLLLAPKIFFDRLLPVLKPGGSLVVTTPNFANLRNILLLIKGTNPTAAFPEEPLPPESTAKDKRVHPREYTVTEIQNSLSAAGFTVSLLCTKMKQDPSNLGFKWRMIKKLMLLTPKHRDRIFAVGIKTP